MKTLFKIMRSIITSLLFIILTSSIIVQFVFTSVHTKSSNLLHMIDKEELLQTAIGKNIEDYNTKEVAVTYINDYMNYIFHKQSYPSLQIVDYSAVSEEHQSRAKEVVSTLNKKINLEYEDVITLRNINNLFSNRAIYLLINIGVFLVFIIVSILTGSFKKGTILLSISLFISSLILLIGCPIFISKINTTVSESMRLFLKSIFADDFISHYKMLASVYLLAGLVTFAVIFAYDKILQKKTI